MSKSKCYHTKLLFAHDLQVTGVTTLIQLMHSTDAPNIEQPFALMRRFMAVRSTFVRPALVRFTQTIAMVNISRLLTSSLDLKYLPLDTNRRSGAAAQSLCLTLVRP